MFFYEGLSSHMTCALKVNTQCKGWYKTMSKMLGKISGLRYDLDAEEGMIYISGKVNPDKILRKIAKQGNKIELCWMRTGDQYLYSNNYAMDRYGAASRPVSAYPYMEPPYQRGFCPPPPPPPPTMPYYQYHNYEPVPCYPPQLPYYY